MNPSATVERKWQNPKDDAPQVVQGKRAKMMDAEVRVWFVNVCVCRE
jgi:hypothetical protein